MLLQKLTKDTPVQELPVPDDLQGINSGDATAPGGQDAPEQSASDMTHGGEGYPGPRAGGETDKVKPT